ELAVGSGARIAQMALDQRAQAEALVQLAREQEPSIGGHGGSSELDAELRIERAANRARCRVTHWVVPSASARSPREPRFFGTPRRIADLPRGFLMARWLALAHSGPSVDRRGHVFGHVLGRSRAAVGPEHRHALFARTTRSTSQSRICSKDTSWSTDLR